MLRMRGVMICVLSHALPRQHSSKHIKVCAIRSAQLVPAHDMLVLRPLKALKRASKPSSGGSWPVTPALLLRSTLSRLYDNLHSIAAAAAAAAGAEHASHGDGCQVRTLQLLEAALAGLQGDV
jgi:hypothetical protein